MEDCLGRNLVGVMGNSKTINEVNLFHNRPHIGSKSYNVKEERKLKLIEVYLKFEQDQLDCHIFVHKRPK